MARNSTGRSRRGRAGRVRRTHTPPQKNTAAAPPIQNVNPVARPPAPCMLRKTAPRPLVPYPASSSRSGNLGANWRPGNFRLWTARSDNGKAPFRAGVRARSIYFPRLEPGYQIDRTIADRCFAAHFARPNAGLTRHWTPEPVATLSCMGKRNCSPATIRCYRELANES